MPLRAMARGGPVATATWLGGGQRQTCVRRYSPEDEIDPDQGGKNEAQAITLHVPMPMDIGRPLDLVGEFCTLRYSTDSGGSI